MAIASGASATRSAETIRPEVGPNSPNPTRAAAEPSTARVTTTVASLAIAGRACDAYSARISVAPWSAIATRRAQA